MSSRDPTPLGHLLRDLAPQVLASLARRHGDFADAEDAVQEALIAAAAQWPEQGVPRNPRGWLYHVATRRLTDRMRSEISRRRREDEVASEVWAEWAFVPSPDEDPQVEQDDALTLLFLCCQPALTAPSQIALTLRAVGGLTTPRSRTMRYMLMMHAPRGKTGEYQVASWSREDLEAHIAFMHEINKELTDRGELVSVQGLAAPGEARVVKAGKNGLPAVTDGPFAEAKEFLAGFWIVDVESTERAYQIAGQVSAAPGPGGTPLIIPVEVRQVMNAPTSDS